MSSNPFSDQPRDMDKYIDLNDPLTQRAVAFNRQNYERIVFHGIACDGCGRKLGWNGRRRTIVDLDEHPEPHCEFDDLFYLKCPHCGHDQIWKVQVPYMTTDDADMVSAVRKLKESESEWPEGIDYMAVLAFIGSAARKPPSRPSGGTA